MDRSVKQYKQQLDRSREWKQRNPDRHAELARAYRRRNPQKLKAQNLLNYAVRKGVVERKPCEGCGTSNKVHAHHHDYTKPYDVEWLCFLCHKKSHPVSDEDKAIKFGAAKHATPVGVNNPSAALDDESVRQIRVMLDAGISQEKIGKAFDVCQVTISRVKRGERWSHVK